MNDLLLAKSGNQFIVSLPLANTASASVYDLAFHFSISVFLFRPLRIRHQSMFCQGRLPQLALTKDSWL